jgi:CPA1 family monovalent cation:H+ antiporter
MAEGILILSAVLGVGFLGTRLAAMLRLPHSVFMVLLGLIGGLTLNQARGPMSEIWTEFPDVVLYVLLPPLVFESAYNLNLEHLRRDLASVLSLATFGLLVSAFIVGFGLHALFGVPLSSALLFGSLISATDPVAVVALFKSVGAPRRLATLVEGESLLNDATAIVLFRVLLASAVEGHSPGVLAGIGQFLLVSCGGLAVGLGFVLLIRRLLRFTSDSGSSQMGLTLAFAYASYIVADHLLGVSGVMSTLTVGLYLGNQARLHYNRQALHAMHALWECVALGANTLVFLAVGWIADPWHLLLGTAAIPAALLIVFTARAAAVVLILVPLNRSGRVRSISAAYQAVLIWAGLRGGLALALVLLLPDSFPHKQIFLAMATMVVLFSLVVNALTTAPLLRALRLNELAGDEVALFGSTLSAVVSRICGGLQGAVMRGTISAEVIDDVRATALDVLAEEPLMGEDEHAAFDVSRLLLAEQRYYDARLEDRMLTPPAWRTLSRAVRERMERLRRDGMEALEGWQMGTRDRGERDRVRSMSLELEVLLHQELALKAASREAESDRMRVLCRAWQDAVRSRLDAFQRSYPHLDVVVQYRYVAGSVVLSARETLDELFESEIIGPAVQTRASRAIDQIRERLDAEAERRLQPSFDDLLRGTPLFESLDADGRAEVARASLRHSIKAGTVVVREGDTGSSFYLVLSGLLEVRAAVLDALETRPRLFAGSFFGEISLLFDTPRTASVVALVDSELAEISRNSFDALVGSHPELRAKLAGEAERRRAALTRGAGESLTLGDLRHLPLFAPLKDDELGTVLRHAGQRRVQGGEVILQAGEAGRSLFVIIEGSVEVETTVSSPARLARGDFFGEMSLLFGTARQTTVRAGEDTTLLELDDEAFRRLMENPEIERYIWGLVEHRLEAL